MFRKSEKFSRKNATQQKKNLQQEHNSISPFIVLEIFFFGGQTPRSSWRRIIRRTLKSERGNWQYISQGNNPVAFRRCRSPDSDIQYLIGVGIFLRAQNATVFPLVEAVWSCAAPRDRKGPDQIIENILCLPPSTYFSPIKLLVEGFAELLCDARGWEVWGWWNIRSGQNFGGSEPEERKIHFVLV